MTLPFHQYADIFPLITGAAFEELCADVRLNGQVDPIDTFEDAILDGRNRARACEACAIAPTYRAYEGTREQALAYVISKNLKRRHLNDDQRRMAAARLANLKQGRPSEENPASCGVKITTAATMLNIDQPGTERARTVLANATPEIMAAIDHGKLTVSAAHQASKLAPETQRKIADEAEAGRANVVRTVIKKERRTQREEELGQRQRALPNKKYGVIYADPEWRFEPYSRETGMDRAPDQHYSTSDTIDIIARPVKDIAADDCVCFLWATAPMLPQALAVLRGWGFEYKTQCIWHKTRNGDDRGAGYWFTGEHELLLVGTRGKIVAPATALCGSVIAAPAGRHSAKPEEEFCGLIERAFPTLPKIELNRRGPARPGWDAWGNESEIGGVAA